jgi:hypothetical protein
LLCLSFAFPLLSFRKLRAFRGVIEFNHGLGISVSSLLTYLTKAPRFTKRLLKNHFDLAIDATKLVVSPSTHCVERCW